VNEKLQLGSLLIDGHQLFNMSIEEGRERRTGTHGENIIIIDSEVSVKDLRDLLGIKDFIIFSGVYQENKAMKANI